MYQQWPVHHSIMVVDVERFSDPARTNLNQLAVRDALYKALTLAFGKSGIAWDSCVSEDRGDGALILVPPDVPKTRLLTGLPGILAAAVGWHNASCAPPERMRLRVALHAGEVYRDAHGVAGTAINHAFRLVEAPGLRSALDASSGVLALIISGWLFTEVVRHDPAAEPGSYRQVQVIVKETVAAGWIRVPDPDAAQAKRNELSGAAGGPAVQARAIYGDVSISVGPPRSHHPLLSQMPPVPANFTGRSGEMAVLEGLAVEPDITRHLAVVVIVGSGGLGKTSLASYWLHRVSDRYPDGTLFAELGGQSPAGAALPENVLAGFLRALGVAPESIPPGVDQQAALFRSVTAGRRMAVFLDNAASAAQVRVLLPGPGPAPEAGPRPVSPPAGERVRPSLVLVTTRWRLAGLAMDGARFLELGSLEEPEARELFGRMVGADRATAEADASDEVVRLCGGIPLAVCVSGARLAAHPRWPVSRIVRELAAERGRLSALSLAGDLSVRAAFDASYQALSADAARAYRMVAPIPGPDFCAGLAAAVLDDEEHAQGLLDALADASLLTEGPDGRYHLHDLARLHAREQAGSGSPTERRAAIARSVTWYLREAVAADLVVLPGRWRLGPLYERASGAAAAYGSPAEALEWLESHLPGLLAAVQAAHDAGLHAQAWQLCEALWGVLLFRKHYAAWLASHETGLRSARACADDCAEAQMHIQVGAAHRSLGRLGSAVRHFTGAFELFRAAGHRLGEASALDQLGVIQLRRARYDKAIGHFTKAREIHQDIGRPRGIALMNLNIGQALAASGRQVEAAGYLRAAKGQFAAISEPYHRARALDALGGALIEIGQVGEAAEPLGRALAITEELGASYDRAQIHVRLAGLAETLGQTERARGHLEQALGLFTGLDAPQAESVRARLAQSGGSPAPGLVAADHQGPLR